jgi:hypothetical protein
MPKTKESAIKDNAGWLLYVGVIGIDKTLSLLRGQKWSLLELEQTLRQFKISKKGLSYDYVEPSGDEKKSFKFVRPEGSNDPLLDRCYSEMEKVFPGIPMPETDEVRVNKRNNRELASLPWRKIDPKVSLGELEKYGLINHYGTLLDYLAKDEQLQRARGRGGSGKARPGFGRWLITEVTLGEIGLKRGQKFNRYVAHSMVLADALDVIAGRKNALPRYSAQVVRDLDLPSYRFKVAEIIAHSKGRYQKNVAELCSELDQKMEAAIAGIQESELRTRSLLGELEILRLYKRKVLGV